MKNVENVKLLWEQGLGVTQIAKQLNMFPSNVSFYLDKAYGKDRPKKERFITTTRKYSLDETYFEKVDGEEKAYFLGLLYADGCIATRNHAVQISLQEEDGYILERFSECIKTNRPIKLKKGGVVKGFKDSSKTYIRKNQKLMAISSKRIKEQLLKLGLTSRKSFTIRLPTNVPDELFHHFIRGIFDGDGGIYSFKNNKWEFSICGNSMICEDIKDYFLRNGVKCKTKKHTLLVNSYYVKSTGRLNCIDLYNLIYRDSTIHLVRKYNKFQECILSTNNVRNGNTWKKEKRVDN